ncbi:MAG: redoxin domain-containing protein [Saprospiraceae bacterium]
MRHFIFFSLLLLLFACKNENSADNPAPNNANPLNLNSFEVQPSNIVAKDYKEKAESPDITLQIEGLTGGGTARLIGIYTDQNYLADSARISPTGEIHFKNKDPYFPGMLFVVLPNNQNIQLLVDLDQTFTMKTKLASLAESMEVEGSEDNKLLYQVMKYEESQRPLLQQTAAKLKNAKPGTPEYQQAKAEQDKVTSDRTAYLRDIFNKNPQQLYTKFKMAGQNPDLGEVNKPDGTQDTARMVYLYRHKFWDGVDFSDERLLYTPVISNKLKRYVNELTPQQPDSIIASADFLVEKVLNKPEYYKYFANWIVLNYDPKESTLMDPQAVWVHMIQKYFTYDKAFWSDSVEVHGLQLRAYEMAASIVGKKAPDVNAPAADGKMHSIYEMKSPYIVVYMWNPDCEHCAEQTPQLVKMYGEWKAKGMDVYGIAVNTEDDKWRAALKKYNMPWVNVFDPTNKSIYAKYYVDNTPEVYVLDPDRNIIAKNLHVDQIQTILERDMEKRKG